MLRDGIATRSIARRHPGHRELWQRVEWIGSKVKAGLPADSAAAKAVARLEADGEAHDEDDYLPSLALLQGVHLGFLNLPPETRTRLMGGWTYDPAYPSPAAVRADEALLGGIAFRYRTLMEVNGSAFGYAGEGVDEVCPAAVRVDIVEGTSQAEAIGALETVLRMVRDQWADVVGPEEWIVGKGGSPDQPRTPTPASNRGEKAGALTAA
jgi:hypothetical protein